MRSMVNAVWLVGVSGCLGPGVGCRAWADDPMPRDYGAVIAAGDRRVWAGGTMGRDRAVQAWSPDRGWQTLPDLPTGRMLAGAAAVGDRVYVVGGTTMKIGVDTNAFEVLDGGVWRSLPPLPEALGGVAAVAHGDKVYAFGGVSNTLNATRDDLMVHVSDGAWVFDGKAWTALAPMPHPRAHGDAVVFDGRIWLVGSGTAAAMSGIQDVDALDPATGTWTTETPLPRGCDCASAVVGGLLVAVGGRDPLSPSAPMVYDPATARWRIQGARPERIGDVIDGVAVIGGELVLLLHFISPQLGGDVPVLATYDPVGDTWAKIGK